MSECFFCGRDEPLTRAHLFQKRIRDSMTVAAGPVGLAASSVTTLGIYRDLVFEGDIRQSNVTSLCGDCNNNWMNSIEVAAAPVFESIMQNKGFPPVPDLFKLAHWASIVGALSSELFSELDIPRVRRREIRYTRTGQAKDQSTYFIWTADYLESVQADLYRAVVGDPNGIESVSWFSVLHAGPLVIISASRHFAPRVARLLEEGGIESVIGAISSNVVYAARGLEHAALGVTDLPTHAEVQAVERLVAGAELKFVKTSGSDVADLSAGLNVVTQNLNFDFGDRLTDVRDQLDLEYLREVF